MAALWCVPPVAQGINLKRRNRRPKGQARVVPFDPTHNGRNFIVQDAEPDLFTAPYGCRIDDARAAAVDVHDPALLAPLWCQKLDWKLCWITMWTVLHGMDHLLRMPCCIPPLR